MDTVMTKGIVCSVDFSDSSKEALKWAVSLARALNSHLTVLYTYRLLGTLSGEASELKKKIEDNANLSFASIERDILTGQAIEYDFKIEVGFVSNRMREYVKKDGISMLVIGGKMSSTNLESFDELAQNLNIPFVVVP